MLSKESRQILKFWINILVAVLCSWLFYHHLATWFIEIYDLTKFESSAMDLVSHNTWLLGFCLIILYYESCYDLFLYSYKLDKILEVKNVK